MLVVQTGPERTRGNSYQYFSTNIEKYIMKNTRCYIPFVFDIFVTIFWRQFLRNEKLVSYNVSDLLSQLFSYWCFTTFARDSDFPGYHVGRELVCSVWIASDLHLVGILSKNKKVLLRERKRHTPRCVASPWRGGTYLGRGGVTYLGWDVPILVRGEPTLAGGYLPWLYGVPTLAGGGTYLGQGVPSLARGYPPWPGGVPTLAGGVPTLAGVKGTPPWPGVPTFAGMGYPSPHVWTDWKHYLPPSFECRR